MRCEGSYGSRSAGDKVTRATAVFATVVSIAQKLLSAFLTYEGVVLNGNRYNAQATDKTHFTVHLHDIKRSKKYLADVYDGNDLIGKIGISVKGKTATVNDDFDDLF